MRPRLNEIPLATANGRVLRPSRSSGRTRDRELILDTAGRERYEMIASRNRGSQLIPLNFHNDSYKI